MFKFSSDPPICPYCGEKVYNSDKGVITPHGVFHKDCDIPGPEEL